MDTENDTTEDTTTKDATQAATSPRADGAVYVEASSRKVQQASEKTKGLQLAPAEWAPLKRPSLGLHQPSNEKADEELQEDGKHKKTADAVAIADEI